MPVPLHQVFIGGKPSRSGGRKTTTVLVACPIGGGLIHEKFRESVFTLTHAPILYLFGNTGESFVVKDEMEKVKGTGNRSDMLFNLARWKIIANARNQVLNAALRVDWDYILWLDSDIEVYPNLIQDLMKHTPTEKIITAEYPYRKAEKPLYFHQPGNPLPLLNMNFQLEKTGPVDVENPPYLMFAGFGCILIKREVHEKVGNFVLPPEVYYGEDIIYGKMMREAGYRIFLSDVKVNHYPKPIKTPNQEGVILPYNYRDVDKKQTLK